MSNPLPLQSSISQSSQFTKAYRVKSFRLGDGFSQRAPDGLNPVEWKGSIVYDNLSATDAGTVIAFIDAIGSWGTFDYQPPLAVSSSKWSIDPAGPSISISSGNLYTISFNCRNEYDAS